MFEQTFDFQQGAISTPSNNNQGFGNYEDPLQVINPADSSQLLSHLQQISDTVIQSIDVVKDILTELNSNPEFDGIMENAFGTGYNQDLADQLFAHFEQNNFHDAPDIELVSGQSFNGAYAQENNTIYLNKDFIFNNNVDVVSGVLLEEFGHYLDSEINVVDAAGDEGDIFSRLGRGESISDWELELLKGEDDHGVLLVDGVSVGIEMNVRVYEHSNFGGAARTYGAGSYSYVGNYWNDKISSIRIDKGWVIKGYEHSNFGGQEILWTNSQSYVGNTWNDKISSLRIYEQDIVLGNKVDFDGNGKSDFIRQEKGAWDDDQHNTADVFLSNGNGTFKKYQLGDYFKGDFTNLIVGDFDGNGKSDFIRQEKGAWDDDQHNTADVFLSNGNGTFKKYQLGDYFKGDFTNLITNNISVVASGYYSELSSLTDNDWDVQSGDDNQFRSDSPFGGGDQRSKTDDRIEQIYTDLSTTIFGSRRHMNTGYAFDTGYLSLGVGYHSGIDIQASGTDTIKTAVNGVVAKAPYAEYVRGKFNGWWMAIDETDGSGAKTGRRWWYGHMKQPTTTFKLGTSVIGGQTVLAKADFGHLHLAVQNVKGHVGNGYSALDVQNRTISPLHAYWKAKNSIRESKIWS